MTEFNFREELRKIYANYCKGKFDGFAFIKKVENLNNEFIKKLKKKINKEYFTVHDIHEIIDKLVGPKLK